MSPSSEGYLQFTAYASEPGGLTRLDAVIDAVERFRAGRPASAIPILDVGCGTGNLAKPLASLGYPMLGIDIDGASVEEAARDARLPNARFAQADPLTYRSESLYGVVVLSEVLEHLPEPARMLNHLHELLVPGGLLVLTVPNGYGPWEAMNFAKKALARCGLGGPLLAFQRAFGFGKATLQSRNPHLEHVQFFTRHKLRKLVSQAGFDVARERNLSTLIGVFPFSWLFRRTPALEALDRGLAAWLPAPLASSWLLELRRRD
ncbi:MAG: class I SAM-dependent methyltransferase [Candidatus Wallbacteria bacterium]|nr:class I SAM-dependent methyltransferase [Candidatus Wallbacteria bacterium]